MAVIVPEAFRSRGEGSASLQVSEWADMYYLLQSGCDLPILVRCKATRFMAMLRLDSRRDPDSRERQGDIVLGCNRRPETAGLGQGCRR